MIFTRLLFLLMVVWCGAVYSATLKIEVVPADAEIYLSGGDSFACHRRGTISIPNLKPGKYALEVWKSGYETQTRSIVVPLEDTLKVSVSLKQSKDQEKIIIWDGGYGDLGVAVRDINAYPIPENPAESIVTHRAYYPLQSEEFGIEGTVLLDVEVFKDGSVGVVKPMRPGSFVLPAIEFAAVYAVKKWTFKPGRRDGIPVDSWVVIPVEFKLSDYPEKYYSSLSVEVDPPEAEIYIPMASVHSWGTRTFDNIIARDYTMRVFCPGYETYEEKMDLWPGEKQERKVTLKKISSKTSSTVVERECISPSGEKTKSYNGLIEPRYKVMYTYPEAARKQKIHGTVIVEAFVGEGGGVIDTRVTQSVQSGPGGLDEIAVNYVKQWRYYCDEGTKQVATTFTIPVKFTLPIPENFKVKVIPRDAEVTISTNTHPIAATFTYIQYIGGLAEGQHLLRAWKPGYETYEETINLDWSKKFRRVIRLKKLNDNEIQSESSKPQ